MGLDVPIRGNERGRLNTYLRFIQKVPTKNQVYVFDDVGLTMEFVFLIGRGKRIFSAPAVHHLLS